jgi:hypothetical protein
MANDGFPVSVEVRRPDGSMEKVRVGTAFKDEDGFTLELGKMSIGSQPVASAPRAQSSSGSSGATGGGGGSGGMPTIFPPYGRSRGNPISGASMQDLEFYANGAHRTLNDAGKARFHDKERMLLQAIEAEMAKHKGGGSAGGGDEEPPPHSDDDAAF